MFYKFLPTANLALGAMGLLTMTQANPAQAVTLLQPFTTTDTFTNFPTASSVEATYYPPLPQFTVQPFNTALGTLTSTTIVWATTASFSGTVGAASTGGSSGFNFGGGYAINGTSYARETLGNTPLEAQKSLNCPNRTLFCVQMV